MFITIAHRIVGNCNNVYKKLQSLIVCTKIVNCDSSYKIYHSFGEISPNDAGMSVKTWSKDEWIKYFVTNCHFLCI